jgi:UDP-N-acetylmuramate dehydrogenase
MKQKDKEWLSDRFGAQVLFDEPMARHTTFGIGGPADAMVTVRDVDQIKDLARWVKARGYSFLILGAGSNLLVRDGGIRGLVLKVASGLTGIEQVSEINPNGTAEVKAGAGVLLRDLAKYALDRGLAGLNFGLGIPGTVGGALRMNAGAWETCIADTVRAISLLRQDGHVVRVKREEIGFSYRGLHLEEGSIILGAEFRLKRVERKSLQRDAIQMQKKRRLNQPLSLPSAGCIFKNPPGAMSAGELIEKAGLKGLRKGDAEISKKHGNFIVNRGHALTADVLALVGQAREAVLERFGVRLELEVCIVGDDAGS